MEGQGETWHVACLPQCLTTHRTGTTIRACAVGGQAHVVQFRCAERASTGQLVQRRYHKSELQLPRQKHRERLGCQHRLRLGRQRAMCALPSQLLCQSSMPERFLCCRDWHTCCPGRHKARTRTRITSAQPERAIVQRTRAR